MTTKRTPGRFDCYEKAELDEPLFVLLARDEHAPEVIRYWAMLKDGVAPYNFASNITPDSRAKLSEKLREALTCADDMREWHKKNRP